MTTSSVIQTEGRSKEEIEALEIAEAARETQWAEPSFVGDLFMGKLRSHHVYNYPEQDPADKKIGDEIVEKVHRFFKEKYEPEKIDEIGEITPEMRKALADLGLFGLKIPKEYGGMGLSQLNYNRVLSVIAAYCSSTMALISAHQSIGVPQPLKLFGTEEQKKKYLPLFAKGAVSAFALTEPGVGSDPARMATIATPIENGNAYSISGEKLWCTNGPIADVLVVMAQTPSLNEGGREKKQITAFIVEKGTPGFEVMHRCRFMGLNGIHNGLLKFTNVRVPKENIIWGLGKGLRLALITLNTGRLSLPAGCIGAGRKCLEYARIWANERKQWGATIGTHEAGAAKIASLSANLLAMEAVTWLSGAWVDHKSMDIRLEAAMAKYFTSVRNDHMIDEVVQLRGGRGYERANSLKAHGEHPFPVERMYRDSRINQIIEGTSEILTLFIAREALDRHLSMAGDLLNPKAPIGKKIKCLFKAGFFYAFWYPRLWLNYSCWPRFMGLGPLARHMRFVHKNARKLARTTFHQMLRHGPGLERKQMQLMRLVDIATELFAMASTIGLAHSRAKRAGNEYANIEQTAEVFCLEARARIQASFRAICCNPDKKRVHLAKKVLKGENLWQEKFISG